VGHLLMMADIKGFGNVQLVSQAHKYCGRSVACDLRPVTLNPLNFSNFNPNELVLGEDLFEEIDITLTFGAQHLERCSHAHPP
jgi:hypothetical protein